MRARRSPAHHSAYSYNNFEEKIKKMETKLRLCILRCCAACVCGHSTPRQLWSEAAKVLLFNSSLLDSLSLCVSLCLSVRAAMAYASAPLLPIRIFMTKQRSVRYSLWSLLLLLRDVEAMWACFRNAYNRRQCNNVCFWPDERRCTQHTAQLLIRLQIVIRKKKLVSPNDDHLRIMKWWRESGPGDIQWQIVVLFAIDRLAPAKRFRTVPKRHY